MFNKLKIKLLARKIGKYDCKYLKESIRSSMDFTKVSLPEDIDYSIPVLTFIGFEPVFIYKEPQWHIYVCFAPRVPANYYSDNTMNSVWTETNINENSFDVEDWRFILPVDRIPEAIKSKILKLILLHKEDYIKTINNWKADYEKREALSNKEKYGKTFSKENC